MHVRASGKQSLSRFLICRRKPQLRIGFSIDWGFLLEFKPQRGEPQPKALPQRAQRTRRNSGTQSATLSTLQTRTPRIARIYGNFSAHAFFVFLRAEH